MSRPYLFDTNALLDGWAALPGLAATLGRRNRRCLVPAPMLGEWLRNVVAAQQRAAGILTEPDTAALVDSLGPVEVVPFTQADADALVVWTDREYGSQADFGRLKHDMALRPASPFYREALRRRGHAPLAEQVAWQKLFSAVQAAVRDPGFRTNKQASTTVDWLLIGMAMRLDAIIVTAERRGEFSRIQGRCVTIEQLRREVALGTM